MLHSSHNLWGQTERQYDALGRITGSHTQYGTSPQAPERFAYDPAGNLKDPQGGLLPGSVLQPGPAGEVPHNQVRVFEDKCYWYDGHGRLIVKLSGAHRAQYFQWNEEHQLVATHTVWSEGQNQRQRPRSLEEAKAQTLKATQALKEAKVTRICFEYDALGRRSSVQVSQPLLLTGSEIRGDFKWRCMCCEELSASVEPRHFIR